MRLRNKVAVITGSGRGIGKAIAVRFAREGASIVVAARTNDEVQDSVRGIVADGGVALGMPTDVSSLESVSSLFQTAVRQFGTVDILVSCAAIQGPIGPLHEIDTDRWVRTIQTNLIGTFLCTKIVLPVMIGKKSGKIITFSGGGAVSPRPRFTVYATSKAAVVRLTESLAEEVGEFNIQVNAIAPGPVNTKLVEEIIQAGEKAGQKEFTEAQKRLQLGGVSPDKAVELALFLASEESNGITGKLISAVWDPWQEESFVNLLKQDKDFATLRRIDNKTFYKRA
jgi:NAD(P)-dependent dehydrogenase (short-subunit alcohol dehydrogenase family)